MTTRKRPDPYSGVEDAATIVRIAEGLLRQWEESRKPWPLMAAFAGAHRARVAVDRIQQEARAAMLARAEAQMRVAREVDTGKAAQAAAARDAGERLVDAAGRRAPLGTRIAVEHLDWQTCSEPGKAAQVATAENAAGRHAPHGTRIAVERLEWQTRMAMLEYAEQQMRAPSVAIAAQPERTAVDIITALRADYAKTRRQQTAWASNPTRPPPQSHLLDAIHQRIGTSLGVSVATVNKARTAWIGLYEPPAGESIETWQPSGRRAREWASSMRLVLEVEKRGPEIVAAQAAAAAERARQEAAQAAAQLAEQAAERARRPGAKTATAPKVKAPQPRFEYSRKVPRK